MLIEAVEEECEYWCMLVIMKIPVMVRNFLVILMKFLVTEC